MALSNAYATLAQFKEHLGVEDDADGTMLEAALNAASRAVDAHCRRRFYASSTATARVYRVSCTDRVVTDDFYTTDSLTVKTDTGDNGTYDTTWTITTDFVVYPDNGVLDGLEGLPYYEILATGSRFFPTYSTGYGNRARVQVTAKWGWTAVPNEVYEATLLKAARIFRRKDSPEGIAGGFGDLGAIRISSREDPDVVMLLAPYVKPSILV